MVPSEGDKMVFVFLAMAEAMTEIQATMKDDLKFNQKRTVNMFGGSLNGLLSKFRGQGLQAHPDFDKMVEIFVETYSEILTQVKEE